MTGGVRQGCPLSPLLYAIAADALLENICTAIPDAVVRAYADDTAVVLTDFWSQAPLLAKIFDDFGALSNLRLNFEKCVIIPLNPIGLVPPGQLAPVRSDTAEGPLKRLRQDLEERLTIWSKMAAQWAGTYLGFVIGPGKKDESWSKPGAKYAERCSLWSGHGHGLQYMSLSYNTFALSTLSYVAQLERPPDWILQKERDMLRKAATGPYNWTTAEDLWHLKDAYGFPISFTCLQWLAKASQLRAYIWDPATANKDHLQHFAGCLRAKIDCPSMPYTKVAWQDWIGRCFVLRLESNYKEFISNICSIDTIFERLACSAQRPYSEETLAAIKAGFQRAAYDELCSRQPYDPEFRIRGKHVRWKLGDTSKHAHIRDTLQGTGRRVIRLTPAWQARRSLHNLRLLASLCTPRVQAAAFGTIFNRWTTARRFQQRQRASNICVFRCSPTAEDSLEHYARCVYTRELASRYLRLDPEQHANLHSFNLCSTAVNTEEDLVCTAILIYAVYRGTNHMRHNYGQQDYQREYIYRMLQQFAREGALNHKYSAQILDRRWDANRTATPIPTMPAYLPSSITTKRHLATGVATHKSAPKRARANSAGEAAAHGSNDNPSNYTRLHAGK